MTIEEAQREVRRVYMAGFPGQLVAGVLWLISAALSTWRTPRQGMLFLVIAGVFIFPLTQIVLRWLGRRATLSRENRLGQLAMQVAFTLPLNLPLVGAATLHRTAWFYPAFMVVLGTHYLPFAFLYGMWQFLPLAALLISAGLWLGLYATAPFSAGAWLTGGLLLLFAAVAWNSSRREDIRSRPAYPS